jgi:hypothetical protein
MLSTLTEITVVSRYLYVTSEMAEDLVREARSYPEEWSFGAVDVAKLPESCQHLGQQAIESLNEETRDFTWSLGGQSHAKPAMAFGRGSIPFHIDEITGLTLLILVYCRPLQFNQAAHDNLTLSGQFLSEDGYTPLTLGKALVFNDCKPHAWLTNSAWAFATFPVVKERRYAL